MKTLFWGSGNVKNFTCSAQYIWRFNPPPPPQPHTNKLHTLVRLCVPSCTAWFATTKKITTVRLGIFRGILAEKPNQISTIKNGSERQKQFHPRIATVSKSHKLVAVRHKICECVTIVLLLSLHSTGCSCCRTCCRCVSGGTATRRSTGWSTSCWSRWCATTQGNTSYMSWTPSHWLKALW